MSSIEILMAQPVRPITEEVLEAEFVLHRTYAAADPAAAIDEVAGRVSGLAIGPGIACNAGFIDRFPKLEIISFYGVGYDPVDAAHAARRGIVVTNTPDVLTEEVADTALGLMIMTVRELGAAERYLRAGRWVGEGPYPFTRGTLRGRTVGILGLGRIGKAIARRCVSFGLEVAYHGRSEQTDQPYRYFPDLADMAGKADILIVVAPGGEATRHMIDARILEALGPDGILINIGRGSVVDEAALIDALRRGVIASAGLDVFENEPAVPADLIAMEQVTLLPHVASASIHTRDLMGRLVADNLVSWFRTGAALTPVAESASITKRKAR